MYLCLNTNCRKMLIHVFPIQLYTQMSTKEFYVNLILLLKNNYRNNMKKNWCKSNTCVETRQSCCAGLQKKSLHIPCYPRQQIRNQRPRHLHLVILQLHRQHLTDPTQLSTPKREIIYSLQPVHVRQPGGNPTTLSGILFNSMDTQLGITFPVMHTCLITGTSPTYSSMTWIFQMQYNYLRWNYIQWIQTHRHTHYVRRTTYIDVVQDQVGRFMMNTLVCINRRI